MVDAVTYGRIRQTAHILWRSCKGEMVTTEQAHVGDAAHLCYRYGQDVVVVSACSESHRRKYDVYDSTEHAVT